jgi:alanyl-tRNA synthetase
MNHEQIRKLFIDFFEERKHQFIPSASLLPDNDPTVLFTTAGMHPLVPYLMGEKHPLGNRIVSIQKCIRTGDIDTVGDNSHHTFFEMLGNWSLGDYFKKEAIEWSYEFLTNSKWLGLDKDRLAVSVFAGDKDAPFDEEAFQIWKKVGINENKIARFPKDNNWWGPAGQTGPCGPDTEIFYWTGEKSEIPEIFNDDDSRWLEIWNNVFMQYNKVNTIKYENLNQRNVDTGMGLERILAVKNNISDNYLTELFFPIIKKIEKLSNSSYEDNKKEMRIIADHLKAATLILGDEKAIIPSNTGQGYVLRRLIRRAIRYGKMISINNFTQEIARTVIEVYKNIYPELINNQEFILDNLRIEEEKFEKTLEHGLREFEKGIDPFILFTTYGFPIELIQELAKEKNQQIDLNDFNEKMKSHQELSRTASAGMFRGGLADAGEITKKLHTATHLLNSALRQVLGNHVMQRGSNINSERLRFDFSHSQKLSPEEIKKVETIINDIISEQLPVTYIEMPKEEALKIAIHSFNEKYGDKVKVYSIGNEDDGYFSREFCGGPHVSNTRELGTFKIVKEEAVASGVRRIKAILL